LPELPDVQVLREYVDATSLHKRIEDVDVISDYILKDVSSSGLSSGLRNHQFESTERHGKFLFILLEYGRFLMLHFGMSGSLKYYKLEDNVVLPDYSQVHFDFENGYRLSLIMPRKLGEVRLLDDMQSFIKQRGLGPDVSADDFTFEKFKDLLAGRRGMIKSTLMNQGIMAGIGNVYSDEILYQARIHPKTRVNRLSEEDLKLIYQKMNHVLRIAIERRANPSDFPEGYLTPLRGGEEVKCPRCEGKIVHIKVSGRTAYFCPACQRINEG
jgi:formamidopyrimidine-DNA glycosylase